MVILIYLIILSYLIILNYLNVSFFNLPYFSSSFTQHISRSVCDLSLLSLFLSVSFAPSLKFKID